MRAAGTLLSLLLAGESLAAAAPAIDAGPADALAVDGGGAAAWTDGIDRLVAEAVAQGKLPGCVVAIGRGSGVVFAKAYGARALLPAPEPMTLDTIFDLASLTKPVATATSLMVLADLGKVDLDAPVARYVPEFGGQGKAGITLRHLLTHTSGLPSETPVSDYEHGRSEALKRILQVRPRAEPGERFAYSDIGFLVLEEVIRRVSGESLASFAETNLYRPLDMRDTGFLPGADRRPRIAPTEQRQGEWMRGQVDDPRAFRLGGVAGNAGLFATADDLARFARMVLGHGALDGRRILSTAAVAQMTAPHDVPGAIRGLGWDIQSGYSNNRGTALSRRAVGHGGYTGTSLWIDPVNDLFVVFLSNRVHPDGKGAVNGLAAAIATLAGENLQREAPVATATPDLMLGIDVLAARGFAPLRGLRFALLTNDSARNRQGARTTDVLAARRDLELVALFSPEHGLSGTRDERIDDGRDAKTRLPVHSLYGGAHGPRTARPPGPRPVTLPADLDAMVIDLPDVGTRFYTYASTVHAVLRAAAVQGVRVIILDRPNPISGTEVAGPVLKPSDLSPVNHHPLPVRHGMTMGELAEMLNSDEHLGIDLHIIRMVNYSRSAYLDETGLAWWPPSPNLRTLAETVLYPALGLLEATNVSVGRGTDTPFEVLGAPWIDAESLTSELAGAGLGGVTFTAAHFTPRANPYRETGCHGVRLGLTDRKAFEPVRTGVAIALALRKLFRGAWNGTRVRGMLGDPAVGGAVLDGRPLAEVEAMWQRDLEAFRAKRRKYLLYGP